MTPEQMRDASLLELFSLEAEAQTLVLSAGLLALERDPTQADHLESCMRAAHSLKGAARIVGVDAGVSVAHVMEDCLVSAQEGRLYLRPEHIDALLQGTDLLMRIATPDNNPELLEIEAYVVLMARLLDPMAAPAPVTVPVAPVMAELQLEPPTPKVETPIPVAELHCAEPPRKAKRTTENGERVLRVTAERLNSLLDLSSKSLVETLRLKPHLATMQRLKRMQNKGLRALENLNVHLKEHALSLEAQEALEDARRLLAESQQLLVEKNAELDEFAWQTSQRAQVLYDTALACRMRPFADVLTGQERMVRDLGRSLGKQVRLEIEGEKTQVDRDVLEKLEAP
ncbi:Hpt domain-containing protein, partial [Pseudomonas sp.]|uniref:Hpt domain-containing protein n=1 Tax=Pseudomonas sp. TaxID=306 RepID=UPI00286AFFD6